MNKIIQSLFYAVFLTGAAFAQQAIRVDPSPITTVPSGGAPGAYKQLLVIPGATVNLCGYPANAVPCTNYSPSFIDQNKTAACPPSSPIVYGNQSGTCQSITDQQGNFGFWLTEGTYSYTVTTPQGTSFGPYPVSVVAPSSPPAFIGAKCDGYTDDTAIFQSALNNSTNGQTLTFPTSPVGCRISSPGLTIPSRDNLTLELGKLVSTDATPVWSFLNMTAAQYNSLTIRNAIIVGSSTTSQSTYTNMACGIKTLAGTTGRNAKFINVQISGTESGICNNSDNFVTGEATGVFVHDTIDPSFLAGRAGMYSVGWGWIVHNSVFQNNPFQDVYLSGDAAPGGSMYSSITDNISINCGSAGHTSACFTSGAYSSSVSITGLIISRNHVYSPHSLAISADGHLIGPKIEDNEVSGATGNMVSGTTGLVQMQGASVIGGGTMGASISRNSVKNSTGNLPCVVISDGNQSQVIQNSCLNNPSASAGILVVTYEGGTVTTENLVALNTVKNSGTNSLQGAGVGAITYSSFINNVIDGIVYNVDPAAAAGNIVAGNNSPAARYWTAQGPIALQGLAVGSYGPSQSPSNGLAVSGQVVVGTPNPRTGSWLTVGGPAGLQSVLTVGISGSNSSAIELISGSSGFYNWKTTAQGLTSQTYEVTPSTTLGGSTYTTPVLKLFGDNGNAHVSVGDFFVDKLKTTTGMRPVCVDNTGKLVIVGNPVTDCVGTP